MLILAVFCFAKGVPSLGTGANLGLGVIWLTTGCFCVMRAAPKKVAE
jgi:hypothetical protein